MNWLLCKIHNLEIFYLNMLFKYENWYNIVYIYE